MSVPFVIDGLGQISTTDAGTVYSIQGGELVIPHPPHYIDAPIPAKYVRHAMFAFVELERVRSVVGSNGHLSNAGKNAKVEPVFEKAKAAMAKAVADLEAYAATLTAEEQKVFEPPKLAPTDAVSALNEQEIRTWARRQATVDSGEVIKAMAEDDKILLAVLRSPITFGMLSDTAKRMWRERTSPDDPILLGVSQRAAMVKWARDVLYWVDKRIREWKPLTDAPIRNPHGAPLPDAVLRARSHSARA